MFALKRFSPCFKFTSKKSEYQCRERKRIHPYNRELFIQNMEPISKIILKNDLKFTSIVAHNYVHFAINDPEFVDLLMNNIKYRLNDLTPDVAFDLVQNLRELGEFDNVEVAEILYQYIYLNYFLFTPNQLASMEKVYYGLGKKVRFGVTPQFSDIIQSAKNKDKVDPHYETDSILEALEIDVPGVLDVFIQPENRTINIKFKDIDKHLQIKGLIPGSWESILQIRDLISNKNPDFIFMEMPPLTQYDINQNKMAKKESILNKFIGDDIINNDSKARHPYLSLFDRYDKLPILDKEFFQWYIDKTFKNESLYRINDSERIVYRFSQGLEIPDEKASILYNLSQSRNPEKLQVLFTDMTPYEELSIIASKKTSQEVKDFFQYGRYLAFNEKIRWALRVNRNGCPMCSKSHKEAPREKLQLLSHKRYNFDIREPFIAKQIVDGMHNFPNSSKYLAFVDEGHMFKILNHICQIYSEEDLMFPILNSQEDIFYSMIRKSPNPKLSDTRAIEDFTNKFAMLAALFHGEQYECISIDNYRPINIPSGSNLDLQLYFTLKSEYNKLFSLYSFAPNNGHDWKKYKQEEKCYAINNLFHDDTTKSF